MSVFKLMKKCSAVFLCLQHSSLLKGDVFLTTEAFSMIFKEWGSTFFWVDWINQAQNQLNKSMAYFLQLMLTVYLKKEKMAFHCVAQWFSQQWMFWLYTFLWKTNVSLKRLRVTSVEAPNFVLWPFPVFLCLTALAIIIIQRWRLIYHWWCIQHGFYKNPMFWSASFDWTMENIQFVVYVSPLSVVTTANALPMRRERRKGEEVSFGKALGVIMTRMGLA